MKFTIITLFPEMFEKVLNSSMLYKAQHKGIVEFSLINLRDFGIGRHRQVDDAPYGGGDGMLLRPEPIYAAIASAKKSNPAAQTILPTPHGQIWSQNLANSFADSSADYIILCPHYEGYDARILPLIDHQICLGAFIMTGGEIPAMAIVDSITRLLPGVLGGETSAQIESFSHGTNLEYPQYTRPEIFNGLVVPPVLLSGNHAAIAQWRAAHSIPAPDEK
jgi:tRNA (guanine37-N1)-methyltransferase